MLESVSAAWVRASMSASGCRTTLWKAPHPEPHGKQAALEPAKVEAAPEVREAKPLVKFFFDTVFDSRFHALATEAPVHCRPTAWKLLNARKKNGHLGG